MQVIIALQHPLSLAILNTHTNLARDTKGEEKLKEMGNGGQAAGVILTWLEFISNFLTTLMATSPYCPLLSRAR